ncbi:hypothetical protein IQ252_06195 [Tychonema sp. LEGE 07203]|nr:S8 family serine peptidase [Tychonema sp. LEGE 07203]MBE9093538.1 hypothetical protein [Tychonema sp. LEGE 07203]
MLQIEASTPQLTANNSIIPDIAEDLQFANYTSNHSSPSAPKNILATNEISTKSSIEVLRSNNKILDKSPENPPQQADIDAFILNKNPTQTINSIAEKPQTATSQTDTITGDTAGPATQDNIPSDSSLFPTDKIDKISDDYLSDLPTSEKDKELIAEATPKTESKLAEKNADSPAVETKDSKELIAEATSKTEAKLAEKNADSPAVETKDSTVSEICSCATNTAETKTENSPATETKNSKVSEIPNSDPNPIDPKTEKSPAVEAKNPTVSEIANSDPKPKNSPATETKNWTVSEIPNSADPKPEKSPVVETKNPTVSENPNFDPTPAEPKPEKSPVTETKNLTVSEIPKDDPNPAEIKSENSPATETKNPKVSEISNSDPKSAEPKTEKSPAVEAKNPTVSEIPNSTTNSADPKAENSPVVETKNPTVSEIPNSTTNSADPKAENSPVVETKNPTVSEIPNSEKNPFETKPENSPATETKNPTVSEIPKDDPNPVETKTEKSPAVKDKKPTVSEISNSATTPVETKTENSAATETQNPTVSEIPNFPTNPVETGIDDITGAKIETTVFIQPEKSEISVIPAASADILTGEIENISPTLIDTPETASETAENFPLISPDEISLLGENLNSILAQPIPHIPETESSQNHQPSASEYIVTDTQTIIPEIAVTENHYSQQSENITADSDNQPQTTIDEYVNPDFDSEKITITPAILFEENNQPDNSENIITDSETNRNEYTITDTENQPLIGIIDTGFLAKNPNIDYSQIRLGKDVIDNDNNPLLQANQGNQHGDTILEIISTSNNLNNTKKAPAIWLGRATGSGNWHQSLIEFADAAKASSQPNAVINLSFDLTQINPDGTQTTRHFLTAEETAALKYAKDNNILIVAAAGNEGTLISALGQASTEFDNIITVGASQNNYRAAYSSYGGGLDILAPTDTHQTAETATNATKQGTSIAAAKVTNTISQMWAANPSLNYQQIKNILLNTAKDIDVPSWDERTGYGIIDTELAIATAAEIIPAIPVFAATKQLTKPLIDADATTNNSDNSTAPKPSERATATTAPGTPKTTTRSTGDSNVGTSSHTTDLAPYKTTSTSGSNGTTTTNSRILSSFSNTESTWDKSSVKTNSKGNSFDESTSDSTTNAATYTSKSFSQNSLEQKNQSQQNYSRVKYEGTRSDSSESAQKSRSYSNYTSPTKATNNSAESYRNSKSQSNSQYGTNLSIANGNRQDDWGSKSSNSSRHTNGNNISTSKSATQTAGNADWTNSSNGSSSNNTHTGEETTVTTSNSTNSNSSGFSKSSNNNDNYSVTNSTWDNTTVNGVAVNSNTRDVYSEGSTNNQSSYDDGKSKNHSYQDTYTVNQSEQTNSSQGSSYRQNNRHNNYSVRQGNDTQTYKHGPQTSSRITDSYSVTKSDGYSANSSGKITSKNNQESYSENFVQNESEYKIDAYTTTSTGDEETITTSRSTSNNDGTNNTSSSSSDTVRTRNGQTVTVYKDGRKDETETSGYERWFSDRNADNKGVISATSGSETWSSSYRRWDFKGGYSWSETISGTDSKTVTKGNVSTTSSSSWSWTRSGTVWDDGRNNWNESWSKSNSENGKWLPGESETARGSYDPKGTGTQTNNLPKAGEAPRLNKAPKDILELNKQPKHKPQPSKEFFEQPIADRPEPEKFSGDFFAGNPSPRKPTFKEQIQKLLNSGAIANYDKIVGLIIQNNSQEDLRSVVGDVGMRTLIVEKFRQRPEMATAIMAALLKGMQRWDNPPFNDFTIHFLRNTKNDNLPYNATMNCWEMIWYAAFLCNQITAERLRSVMDKVGYKRGGTFSAMPIMGYQDGLPFYPNRGVPGQPTRLPKPGQLVFFKGTQGQKFSEGNPGHVAIALNSKTLVSLWDKPNNNNTIQIIDVSKLEGYVQVGQSFDFWKDIIW